MLSGVVTGDRLRVGSDFGFGFDGSIIGEIQTVAVRMARLPGYFNRNTFDGLLFRHKRTDNEVFRIDNVRITKGYGSTVTINEGSEDEYTLALDGNGNLILIKNGLPLTPAIPLAGFDGGTLNVNQVAHGFAVGEAIKFDGANYIKAQADAPANSDTIGVVSVVTDVDNFTFQYLGIVTTGVWVDGTHYFLSPSVAGAIIAEPTYAIGEVRQYIGQGIPEGLLLNINIGDEIESGDDLLEEDAAVTGAKNVDWTYHTFLYTMTGNTVFSESNLPLSGINTKVITMHMDGNFTPTFPAGWDTYLTGAYVGTKLNTIVVEFVKTGFYKMQITQDN